VRRSEPRPERPGPTGPRAEKLKRKSGRLRVIAGEVGGRHLVVPPGVRPTADRVREALFSALGSDTIEGASVLDLYAGSGALAIEALSRGASRALLVERDRAVADVCRQNLESTDFAGVARVQVGAVLSLVVGVPPPEAPFGIVLCDPPYETPEATVASVLESLLAPGWLAAAAVVVAESAARTPPARPAGFEVFFERKYGDTLVTALIAPG
jgi:16S rRNA (guanine966-N2)-methyltransferase